MADSPDRAPDSERTAPLVVIKVGTSTILDSALSPPQFKLSRIARIVETIVGLRRDGVDVILIASGAVGSGCIKLRLTEKPVECHEKQAVAAAGQSFLLRLLEDQFGQLGQACAQLLLTRGDFASRHRWVNVRKTIRAILAMGVVPVVNENDAVAPKMLANFGDNDSLASLVAVQAEADWLFLCTDVPAVYDRNPSSEPEKAQPVRVVADVEALAQLDATGGGQWGTGGMGTKLNAARMAAAAGIKCALVEGSHVAAVPSLMTKWGCGRAEEGTEGGSLSCSAVTYEGVRISGLEFYPLGTTGAELQGTYFAPMAVPHTINSLRRWLVSLPVRGKLFIDAGAADALMRNKSLLGAGVRASEGNFEPGECVLICLARHQRTLKEQAEMEEEKVKAAVARAARCSDVSDSEIECVDDGFATEGPNTAPTHSQDPHSSPERTNELAGLPQRSGSGVQETREGAELGWGVVNFSSTEIRTVAGKHSRDYASLLGTRGPEVVDRDKFFPAVEKIRWRRPAPRKENK